MKQQFPRLLGTKAEIPASERVETEISDLIARAEALLGELDAEQQGRYDAIASLSVQIEHHEAEITRGAALARRLQQVRSVLETGNEERDL